MNLPRIKEDINKINFHPKDEEIKFIDEGHIYFVDGLDHKEIVSVTTLLSRSYNSRASFDSCVNFSAERIAKGDRWWNDETYEYYLMPIEKIIQRMKSKAKEKCDAGSDLHNSIDMYYKGEDVYKLDYKEWRYFVNFVNDHKHLDPVRSEMYIFHRGAKLAGSIDKLMFDKRTQTFVIVDWKRVKAISKNSKTRMIAPVEHLPDCNYAHYSLQLNLYRRILMTEYGINVSRMILVQLHPDRRDYVIHECPIMDKEIDMILINRLYELEHDKTRKLRQANSKKYETYSLE